MKKISNPFASFPGYNCFGCSMNNSIGLRMQFFEDGDEIISEWHPNPDYQGWNSILHGGIQSTLMDEIASWFVFVKLKTFGVTSRINVLFRKPVLIEKGNIILHARLSEIKRNIAFIYVSLFDGEGQLCTDGTIQCYTYEKDKPIGNMKYPGHEKFINE